MSTIWLLALLIFVLAIIASFVAFLFYFGDDDSYPYQLPAQVTGIGKLPFSVQLKGQFYRWHKKEHLFTGKDFWKTFQDGPWKWEEQQRFAGAGLNCGHYFSLTEQAASEEARFYDIHPEKGYQLLDIDATLDSVLDLTNMEHIKAVFRRCVGDPENLDEWPAVRLFARLVHSRRSGNTYTDAIGLWAAKQGYDGILFFSARVHDLLLSDIEWAGNPNIFDESWDAYHEIRKKRYLNLVVFSGLCLTTRISTYSVQGANALTNPYFEAQPEDINELCEFGIAYQEEQKEFIYRYPLIGSYIWQYEHPDLFEPSEFEEGYERLYGIEFPQRRNT